MKLTFPRPLKPGDKIAVISPATEVKREYVEGAVRWIEAQGFVPQLMDGVLGPAEGSFAASRRLRQDSLFQSLADPDIRAILCARGGYGCVHLLPELSPGYISADPKWLVGFSDVSALHAAWHAAGVASIHAGMAKHLTTLPGDDRTVAAFRDILAGAPSMKFSLPSDPHSRPGEADGILLGGNLAVLQALIATPYDILLPKQGEEVILFMEDIAEPIYKVERILYQLALAGVFRRVKGVIFGQFTDYRPDRNFGSMELMLRDFAARFIPEDIPVAYSFPVGHVDFNLPLVEGARTLLSVTPDATTLTQQLA